MACQFSYLLSLFLIISLQFSVTATQLSGIVGIDQSLTATSDGSGWISPGGDFAFGFHPFNNTRNFFLLAIWYAKIPDTIVWYANEGNPVPQGSTVKLAPDDGIVLANPGGTPLWSTSSDLAGGLVGHGFMNDTGNFILLTRADNQTIWESFAHPTDTLLPTQVIRVGTGTHLDSRISETNFTKGRFQMQLLNDKGLVLNARDPATNYSYGNYYYQSGTGNSSQLVYDETGNMYIVLENGLTANLTSDKAAPGRDYYHRATLNFDGVLIWSYHPRNFSKEKDVWSTAKVIPDNICVAFTSIPVGSGACGYNSICSLGQDKRRICGCPPDYSLLDPEDAYGDCKPDFQVDLCDEQGSAEAAYQVVKLQGVDWPQNDYAQWDGCTEEAAQSMCLDDCFCAAVIFEHSTQTCWKKRLPLSNGNNDSSVTRVAWLKVGDPSSVILPGPRDKLNILVSALLGGSVFVNFCLITVIGFGIFLVYRKKPYRQHEWIHTGQRRTLQEYSNIPRFSYQELHEATNGFTEELGRGAFGIVYKGMIGAEGPPKSIAVKKLDRLSNDADKEFKTEVNVIGQTHHRNLVQLVGFCKEEDQRLLVFEYMSNGSLADYLFGNDKPSWNNRIGIALGIVRGLLYLHEECITQIIHCDIKPQNILLDEYHNARISDFGLAKLLVLNQTQTNTAIRGTKGYVAPEWFRNKPITVKVDVYSFGVLLLEIICCRKSVLMEISPGEAILTDWAFDCYQANRVDSLVRDDKEALVDRLRLQTFVRVALWCIQEDPNLRPTMRMILQMLEGVLEVPNPPCPTSFTVTSQS